MAQWVKHLSYNREALSLNLWDPSKSRDGGVCVYSPKVCMACMMGGRRIRGCSQANYLAYTVITQKRPCLKQSGKWRMVSRVIYETSYTPCGRYVPRSHTWTCVHNVNIPIIHTNYLGLKHNGADSSKTVFTSKYLMLPTMVLGLHPSCIHNVLDPPIHTNEADTCDREFGEKQEWKNHLWIAAHQTEAEAGSGQSSDMNSQRWGTCWFV